MMGKENLGSSQPRPPALAPKRLQKDCSAGGKKSEQWADALSRKKRAWGLVKSFTVAPQSSAATFSWRCPQIVLFSLFHYAASFFPFSIILLFFLRLSSSASFSPSMSFRRRRPTRQVARDRLRFVHTPSRPPVKPFFLSPSPLMQAPSQRKGCPGLIEKV